MSSVADVRRRTIAGARALDTGVIWANRTAQLFALNLFLLRSNANSSLVQRAVDVVVFSRLTGSRPASRATEQIMVHTEIPLQNENWYVRIYGIHIKLQTLYSEIGSILALSIGQVELLGSHKLPPVLVFKSCLNSMSSSA